VPQGLLSTACLFVALCLLVPAARASEPFFSPKSPPKAEGYRLVTLADGLQHPWGLAWLPNGDLLITERPGRLRLFRDGRLVERPLVGVPDVFAQGQGGLLDVALHPDFADNRLVYLSYAAGERSANGTRVARGRLEEDRLSGVEEIAAVEPLKRGTQHFGSRLLFLPDGSFLMTVGDGGNPPLTIDGDLSRLQAQDLDSRIGKILRFAADGRIPADNPFADDPAADPAVWTYGHRNAQGLARDPETGAVWASEHGSRGGDEINLIEKGNNYGWPRASYSDEYSGGRVTPHDSLPGMVGPRLVWTPSIAPSGLAVYRGEAFPEWRGDLFAGGLVSRDLRRIRVDAAGEVVAEESLRIGERVRQVALGPDGLLYVLTDQSNGKLIRIEPAP